jgi:hypothetical protein
MNNENVQWFSQTLMTHKDKVFGTDGYLRLSLSTNTEDFKFFNPPNLSISITNNYQKACTLNIQNAKDLIKTFKIVVPQLNGDPIEIQRKYNKNTLLYIKFFIEQSNQTRVVLIEIRNNETDFTRIIIPLEGVFEAFAYCIREFSETYMSICTQMMIQSIQSESTKIIHQLPHLIKGISSQIVHQTQPTNTILDSRATEAPVEPEAVKETQATIADLDKFLGDDMSNINVPEIDNEPKPVVVDKVESQFISKVLDNDLVNLENLMASLFLSENPIDAVCERFIKSLDISDDNFKMLPGITEEAYKSLVYMTKLIPNIAYQNFITTSMPIPDSLAIFKYKPSNYTDLNLEIAYDLLTISIFIKCFRSKAEGKTSESEINRSVFHLQFRSFTDALTFGFIENLDPQMVSSLVLKRYKYYESIGFFENYQSELEQIKCSRVDEIEISSTLDRMLSVIPKCPYIEDLHEMEYKNGNLKMPTKTQFNLEQIINGVVPVELAQKLGKSLEDEGTISSLKSNYQQITDDVLNIFTKKTKETPKKKKEKTQTTTTNLLRVINSHFSNEIPEQYKDKFIDYITKIGNNKFNLNETDFPIDEFGDNVIKALYLWNPEEDPSIARNYKKFFTMIEEEIMERDLILTKIKSFEKVEKATTDAWDFA